MDTYKEKYEQALDQAVVMHKAGNKDAKQLLEAVFPQLKENEDEKIRKELIGELKSQYGNLEIGKRWVAWLENQGTFAINHDDEIMIEQLTIFFASNREYGLQNTNETYIEWLNGLKKKLEKQGGERPYTFNVIPRLLAMIEPTDKAKSYCRKLIGILKKEGYSVDANIVGEWLKQMNGEEVPLATMDEQKLFSKKRRFIPQPNQEWSQDDQTGLADALWCVKVAESMTKDENDMGNIWYADRWLKSLQDRYAWNPSEQQIRALEYIIEKAHDESYSCNIAKDLLADLKKLKGE